MALLNAMNIIIKILPVDNYKLLLKLLICPAINLFGWRRFTNGKGFGVQGQVGLI
jgi:hypothetical protein